MKLPLRIDFLCDYALKVVDKDDCVIFELTVEDYSIPRETIADLQTMVDMCNNQKFLLKVIKDLCDQIKTGNESGMVLLVDLIKENLKLKKLIK
jgi:hypothetical protein